MLGASIPHNLTRVNCAPAADRKEILLQGYGRQQRAGLYFSRLDAAKHMEFRVIR